MKNKMGVYVAPNGRLVILREAHERRAHYLVYRQSEVMPFMNGHITHIAPIELVLNTDLHSESVVLIDFLDAKLLLESYEYLGEL